MGVECGMLRVEGREEERKEGRKRKVKGKGAGTEA
jgi:hypothetical protein